MEFISILKKRRTRYDLTGASSISDRQIEQILADSLTYTPSSFHSQSARAVLLLAKKHDRLWQIVKKTLQKIVPAESFAPTEKKLQSFAAGYGTVLFFEDTDTVELLEKNFPRYADQFPVWSNQSAGMLQFAVWTAFAQEGLGASLQHYNPLIDESVRLEFGTPPSWKLVAQMPFGIPYAEPSQLTRIPIEQRLRILGGEKND